MKITELLKLMDILEDIYNDPQGGIGREPNFQWPPNRVRNGIKQIRKLIENKPNGNKSD